MYIWNCPPANIFFVEYSLFICWFVPIFFFNIFIFGFSCLFTNTHGNYAATIVYLYLLDVLHFASVSLRALDFLLFN